MNHSFNVTLATDFSVNIALFVAHVEFWTFRNLANKSNIHDGLCWSFNTLEALQDIFPYWTKSQRETVINNAVKEGLVVKGNYNQTKYDRTVWYALTPAAYGYFPHLMAKKYLKILYSSISEKSEMEFSQFGNRFLANRTPIPDTLPVTDPNTITTSVEDAEENNKNEKPVGQDVVSQVLDKYHKYMPELVPIKSTDRALISNIRKMVRSWPKYQKEGKQFTIELFVDFLKFVRNHHSWFLAPYPTAAGNSRKNSLRNLISDTNLAKFANGEFHA